jgi:hypothetical protein
MTMSGMYGADPDQLQQLGATMRRQIAVIDGVLTAVGQALSGTTWTGPARDRFESEWHGSFTGALRRLDEAFEAAGTDCVQRSDELRRVMGSR